MPLNRRAALRGLAGFLAGIAAWFAFSPLYDPVIIGAADLAIRIIEPQARLSSQGSLVVVDETNLPRSGTRPALPVDELTFNFAILTALFAAGERPFSDRNVGHFLLGSLILAVTHVFGVVAEVMAMVVMVVERYGTVATNAWGVATHGYRLVFMYAVAFAIWWALAKPTSRIGSSTKKRSR